MRPLGIPAKGCRGLGPELGVFPGVPVVALRLSGPSPSRGPVGGWRSFTITRASRRAKAGLRETMAKEGQGPVGLDAIAGAVGKAAARGAPPVHLWNPPFCGDIDMKIASDGTWFYQKTPIERPALVKLFASVLKREGEKYFLVTPVEKVGIVVEDAPFLAVELKVEHDARGQVFGFRTNVDDI